MRVASVQLRRHRCDAKAIRNRGIDAQHVRNVGLFAHLPDCQARQGKHLAVIVQAPVRKSQETRGLAHSELRKCEIGKSAFGSRQLAFSRSSAAANSAAKCELLSASCNSARSHFGNSAAPCPLRWESLESGI